MKEDLNRIKMKIDKLNNLIFNSNNDLIIKNYEKELEKFIEKRYIMESKIETMKSESNREENLEYDIDEALDVLENPYKIWKK
jgi:hypothetical protein